MATVWRPSSDAARNTRIAISLRLATRIRLIGADGIAVIMESCPPQRPTIAPVERRRVRHLKRSKVRPRDITRAISRRWCHFHETAKFMKRMLTQNSVVEGAQIPGIMKLEYWAPRANVRTGWCPVGGAHGA